jgi:hypothetical protein
MRFEWDVEKDEAYVDDSRRLRSLASSSGSQEKSHE